MQGKKRSWSLIFESEGTSECDEGWAGARREGKRKDQGVSKSRWRWFEVYQSDWPRYKQAPAGIQGSLVPRHGVVPGSPPAHPPCKVYLVRLWRMYIQYVNLPPEISAVGVHHAQLAAA